MWKPFVRKIDERFHASAVCAHKRKARIVRPNYDCAFRHAAVPSDRHTVLVDFDDCLNKIPDTHRAPRPRTVRKRMRSAQTGIHSPYAFAGRVLVETSARAVAGGVGIGRTVAVRNKRISARNHVLDAMPEGLRSSFDNFAAIWPTRRHQNLFVIDYGMVAVEIRAHERGDRPHDAFREIRKDIDRVGFSGIAGKNAVLAANGLAAECFALFDR